MAMIVLEIRHQTRRTSIASHVKLDEILLAWLIERADERGVTPAEIAAEALRMIVEDDSAAHSETVPETATIQ
jgi:hypothetical protein